MTTDTLPRVFAALADPTRRDMVARLSEGDAAVSQLAEPYRMTLQAVYKHLRVLEDAGLVSRTPGPQPRSVHLEVEVFDQIDTWIERFRRRVEQRYRRLDAVLTSMKETDMNRITETVIEADPRLPVIRMTRDFTATPEQLFRAHTDPVLFAQWIGPDAMATRIEHWDATTGGSWRYVSVRDGTEYGFRGCFHEVRPDRIVQTFTFEGDPEGVALTTLWFEDLGDDRTRLRTQMLVDSFEGRDAWLRSGMNVSVDEGYAKLERMVIDGAV
jgi:uncharacterized protein YndB with AHSA1/START domain/DNA-binding transcriptional ArsR family regulator